MHSVSSFSHYSSHYGIRSPSEVAHVAIPLDGADVSICITSSGMHFSEASRLWCLYSYISHEFMHIYFYLYPSTVSLQDFI